ncbi:hypothetical protein [Helicobacter sp.]|uniref:hypothetical protein n=1 Tax=Helicobacter sp. TaxID=218 RepID=UPI00199ABA5D|nr:hypothetical protein [Helicobacter sp.]MBD5165229.1 hypothetical protein [Helicobacter sp.]
MEKTRIKNKEHLEQIFKQFAENEEEEFSPDLLIEGNSELSLKDLIETCEVIGYENLLLDDEFVKNPRSHCDTFYIDLIGIKELKFGSNDKFVWFMGGKIPDELSLENDGTLRVWFD